MKLLKAKMNKKTAEEILKWKYDPPYDFYNNELTEGALEELLNGTYSIVLTEKKETFGFFCMGASAQVPAGSSFGIYEENCIDLGLGMYPGFTGKGNSVDFGSFVLRSIEEKRKGLPIRLTVAAFNKRAIHLYAKLGFVPDERFSTHFTDFITMVKKY
ncbi:N-acetyltransferase [Planococcus sp. CPCC 101016]|uniref:GNAT family N-acetyltransferase n=1 Tax=Planococcus sp. CPCC 101016 TaxID=2599617 RepID=UPI0011B59E51|nr:GNAT family N-acetyltransferase [Planococcus sp. CPCC 101016]TWT03293.1 N-acetyltransferase [Planococcus sp. CPCC 101016]